MSPMQSAAIDSPSADRTGRYPEDAVLRKAGYRIHARPKDGPAVWETGRGELLTQAEAMARLDALLEDVFAGGGRAKTRKRQ